MLRELLKIEHWTWPFILLAAGILLGIVGQWVLSARLAAAARRSPKGTAEVWRKALRGMIVTWFSLAGAYLGAHCLLRDIGESSDVHHMTTKVLFTVVAITVTFALAELAVGYIRWHARESPGAVFSTSIFVNLARLLIVVMGAIIVLDSFGVSVTHIITVMGLGGLAVALALQPTLATFFSGLQILASKQVRVGDFVKLDTGEDGYVQDITWRVTTLRTLSNNLVFIPNAKLSAAVLTNYSLPDKGVDLRVQVCMNTTTDHFAVEKEALAIAREITKEAQGDIPGFEPYVHYNAITETSTNFIVVLRVREYSDMYRMRDKFIRKLTERLEKEGVFKSVMTVDKVV